MNELSIMHAGMLALSQQGHCVFRANIGQAWTGDAQRTADGCMLIRNPRPFKTGLPPGFADTFGFTQDLRPFFIEWKTPTGRVRPEQRLFIEAMQARGAIAGIARSVDDIGQLLNQPKGKSCS